eukprot:jgi/Mesen1/7737/ME000407S06971
MSAMENGTAQATTSGKNKGVDYEALDVNIETQRKVALEDKKINEALENLLNIEKQMRLAADITGTKKVVLAIIQICHASGDWKNLNEHIVLLSKRRAQLKQAVSAMVQEAMGYIEVAPDLDTRVKLIETLSTVTAGKIYVEIERARLTKRLAGIKEEQGLVKEAAEIMQEVAVETFGAMAKTEKIAFILEQVRLCLDIEDYMRAQILAKKINPRVFAEETEEQKKKKKVREGDNVVEAAGPDVPLMPALKRTFYELMVRYYSHKRDYLEICRSYQAIYDTSSLKDDPKQWMPVLKKICWYIVLAPHDSMQSSLLNAAFLDKKLQDLPKYKQLLKRFITMEVVSWPQLTADFQVEFQEQPEIFGGPDGSKSTDDLRQRVIEHNILVVSKYYSRITCTRLAELLDLPVADSEKHLSEMVVSKALRAKVDRVAGIVNFQGRLDSNDMLNTWARSIEKLLDLVETSCHKIHKETMVHKITLNVP